jgi:hypothetical protein
MLLARPTSTPMPRTPAYAVGAAVLTTSGRGRELHDKNGVRDLPIPIRAERINNSNFP